MKKFHLCAVIGASLALTACATPTWNKAGVSPYETNNQLAKCQYDIGMNKISQNEREALLAQCMKSKGFRYN